MSSLAKARQPDGLFEDAVKRMRYLDLATYLQGDILTKVDRATMAASLEARAPLLDHRLVEWSFRVRSSIHIRDGEGRWLLRKMKGGGPTRKGGPPLSFRRSQPRRHRRTGRIRSYCRPWFREEP